MLLFKFLEFEDISSALFFLLLILILLSIYIIFNKNNK